MTPLPIHAEHLRLGFRSANCEACYPTPSPAATSWHALARANTLPTLIVGGVPISPLDFPAGAGREVLPRASASGSRRDAELAPLPAA